MVYNVTVTYSDNTVRELPVAEGQTILQAAEAHGIPIVSECENGVCGTCIGNCSTGSVELGDCIGLSKRERENGRILTCQARVTSDCAVALGYSFYDNAARLVSGVAHVRGVDHISEDVVKLTLDLGALATNMPYQAGQYAQLNVPHTDNWRSYSFAKAPEPGRGDVDFLIRLLPSGVMSDYLRSDVQPGTPIRVRGPKGKFQLRQVQRPILLVAGGTGLSAIFSIAQETLQHNHPTPVRLLYGVTHARDLAFTAELDTLAAEHSRFTWRGIVEEPAPEWTGPTGRVTDLLRAANFDQSPMDVYLCGPPTMVDACCDWLHTHGHSNANVYYEKFVQSGAQSGAATQNLSDLEIDIHEIRRQGIGKAVVIGGSIAGMAAAKVLSAHYGHVEVLEKGQIHRRMEGRPDSAQGWHLHHLLIAGQLRLEAYFPGIINDMVAEGAFKVDMGEQYKLMLAGSWKKQVPSGVEILCGARPLLEWCIRRRLDLEPGIDYRYESELQEIVYDKEGHAVIGVIIDQAGELKVIPAQLVVDASGKNTRLPELLSRHQLNSPVLDEDQINCFYSSMMHSVPPELVRHDKVMTICYAQRPQQKYYAAQYYLDQSRTILCTSLVGYDCYDPPRNAAEFREFARRMPAPDIGRELDGLEPCSPVRNFRYPTMQRYLYEDLADLPGGVVAVGDAYSSADPVSGAGMSKALMEVDELRILLETAAVPDTEFVRHYYRRVGEISDQVWSVIREQNLRYPWIEDVESKRPPLFGLRNWYVDRVFEALHDDPDIYKLYLMVSHFVLPASALGRPGIVVRVLGRWLKTRLSGRPTLIQQNFGQQTEA